MTNINEILREHVTLTVDCMDRINLNGYIPNLQVPGQLVNFLIKHRGNVIPSPILLGKIGEQFKQAIQEYAQKHEIPLVHFESGQHKDELAAEYRLKFDQAEGGGLHRGGAGASAIVQIHESAERSCGELRAVATSSARQPLLFLSAAMCRTRSRSI